MRVAVLAGMEYVIFLRLIGRFISGGIAGSANAKQEGGVNMKNLMRRAITIVPAMAMFVAGFTAVTTCRLWFCQPPVPAKLREKE